MDWPVLHDAALGAAALASILAFGAQFARLNSKSSIQLPEHEPDISLSPGISTVHGHVQGIAYDEERFRTKMRLRSSSLAVLLAVAIGLQTTLLYDSVSRAHLGAIASATISLSFTIYILLLVGVLIRQSCSAACHAAVVVHIALLAVLGTIVAALQVILPASAANRSPALNVDASDRNLALLGIYTGLSVLTLTTPRGPPLRLPIQDLLSQRELSKKAGFQDGSDSVNDVCIVHSGSVWDIIVFSYAYAALRLGADNKTINIADFPVVPLGVRSSLAFAQMRAAARKYHARLWRWEPKRGSGVRLAWQLARVNGGTLLLFMVQTIAVTIGFYLPVLSMKMLLQHLQTPRTDRDPTWGWVYALGLPITGLLTAQIWDQLSYVALMKLQYAVKAQLNALIFAKTLVLKDISASPTQNAVDQDAKPASEAESGESSKPAEDDGGTAGKSQVMTLFTTDVDRIGWVSLHIYGILNGPISVVMATVILYNILGVSSLIGLGVAIAGVPFNKKASTVVVHAQEQLMKSRDERTALMTEILGAMKTLKYMAWERTFESKIMNVRGEELKWQKSTFTMEVLLKAICEIAPILMEIVSFWHFAVVRGQALTPSVAFTALAVYADLRSALNNLPGTWIAIIQFWVSIRRIEQFLESPEISRTTTSTSTVALKHATVTWPRYQRVLSATHAQSFAIKDADLQFPAGRLSLICGKVGSGKSLLLLALLGEADVLHGQVLCPRTSPDTLSNLTRDMPNEQDWIVDAVTAYVPQTPWLRNATIRDNILFNLPYVKARYENTLQACALAADLALLEDGDQTEIGEQGIGLSGGQKARVCLARAVYSRASVVLMDDIFSAVDAHTASHIYDNLFHGLLLRKRTVILVSHQMAMCLPKASYVVKLVDGHVEFAGAPADFEGTVQDRDGHIIPDASGGEAGLVPIDAVEGDIDVAPGPSEKTSTHKKVPRKLIEDESRGNAVANRQLWLWIAKACGGLGFWLLLAVMIIIGAAVPVIEKGWLKVWSAASLEHGSKWGPLCYLGIYAAIRVIGLFFTSFRWYMLYTGSIKVSATFYKNMLESVLFATMRFHDTVTRGTLLNRFGRDFEVIDSHIAQQFGTSVIVGLDMLAVFILIAAVGGWLVLVVYAVLGIFYIRVARNYSKTAKEMRRLDSIARSPLYSIYAETVAGLTVIRAFGASSQFMGEALQCMDTCISPDFWMQALNRYLSCRLGALSQVIIGFIAVASLVSPSIDASLAGFALSAASQTTFLLTFLIFNFISVEQSMVAVERIKEFTELGSEGSEYAQPGPSASWPQQGTIEFDNIVIRYAPGLPNVLHGISIRIEPGQKVGVVGRTGSGKSTLAMSLLRFVEAAEGRITIDGVDISEIGLTDLRRKVTIVPQDPTILSGTIRSVLDVFSEYADADLFTALKRVHLIPSETMEESLIEPESKRRDVFRNLDSTVADGGSNFSAGEKQLLCLARAVLRKSKILVMDEATASIDLATDKLIGEAIRHEFRGRTVLTIAHRLRTIMDYDRVLVLDEGTVVEDDSPTALLANSSSRFHALCRATGDAEFSVLQSLLSQ